MMIIKINKSQIFKIDHHFFALSPFQNCRHSLRQRSVGIAGCSESKTKNIMKMIVVFMLTMPMVV